MWPRPDETCTALTRRIHRRARGVVRGAAPRRAGRADHHTRPFGCGSGRTMRTSATWRPLRSTVLMGLRASGAGWSCLGRDLIEHVGIIGERGRDYESTTKIRLICCSTFVW